MLLQKEKARFPQINSESKKLAIAWSPQKQREHTPSLCYLHALGEACSNIQGHAAKQAVITYHEFQSTTHGDPQTNKQVWLQGCSIFHFQREQCLSREQLGDATMTNVESARLCARGSSS